MVTAEFIALPKLSIPTAHIHARVYVHIELFVSNERAHFLLVNTKNQKKNRTNQKKNNN